MDKIVLNYLNEPQEITKYHRQILPDVWVDVYDVIGAFEVNDGGYQHALKKILVTGQRGYKTEAQDRKDVADSIARSDQRFKLFNPTKV